MKTPTVLLIGFAALCGTISSGQEGTVGVIVKRTVEHGTYLQFVPKGTPVGLLVVVHGTPNPNEDVAALAETFLKSWIDFSKEHSLAVIAPVFDDDYGSRDQPTPGVSPGGYRALFGRQTGADEFLGEIVAANRHLLPAADARFYLYGHSAGGQFTSRYCVRHPEGIRAAVISAGGRYAFPDAGAPWPYGMGKSTHLPKAPDQEGWLKAATLPIHVVVGANDLEPQPERPGHEGVTRVEIAESWVKKMNLLAQKHGKTGQVKLTIVEGIGHSSKGLTPAAQQAMAGFLVPR